MTQVERRDPGPWTNEHGTQHVAAARGWNVSLDDGPDTRAADWMAASARDYQQVIAAALAAGDRLVPLGSAWSFSDLVRGDGELVDGTGTSRVTPVADDDLAPSGRPMGRDLFLVSAGTRLESLSLALEGSHSASDHSIRTSGSYNGQTIGGLIGTGTHGSVVGYGAFQNHVRGVHIVTGPDSSVWIERGPAAVMSDEFVAAIGARRVLDADSFDAAIVHLGGLGIINAVLLEAAPFFRVEVYRTMAALTADDLAQLAAGSFRAFSRRHALDEDPYAVEITGDPFSLGRAGSRRAMVTFLYRRAPDAAKSAAQPVAGEEGVLKSPTDHLGDQLALLATHKSAPVPAHAGDGAAGSGFDWLPPVAVADLVTAGFLMQVAHDRIMGRPTVSWNQANGKYTPRTLMGFPVPLHNDAYSFERARLAEVLPTMLTAFAEQGGGHLVVTLRFVTRAAGLLAFTRFADTVVANFDGIRTPRSAAAGARMAAALEQAGIPFSQHWGKMGDITPARFVRDFGDPAAGGATPAARWRAVREALLGPAVRPLFSNPAIVRWGLA